MPALNADARSGAAARCPKDGYVDRAQAVVAAFAEVALGDWASDELRAVGRRVPAARGLDARVGLRPPRGGGARRTRRRLRHAGACDAPGWSFRSWEARRLFYSERVRERLLEPLVVSGERRFAAKQLAEGWLLASDLAAAGDPGSVVVGLWLHTVPVTLKDNKIC